ncbi:variable surface protein [Plasmodium gonderi]|uniref:Variable surface protein n=1 Tax=Plasmodium gonderi TaxID=77519 RepID=A0A1Y1JSG6_PLAGO|nr:variable surface protein [Plasmodium gonderi]GAW84117.1 variable surface protein [Plasmodium gonderi]
MEGIDYHLVEKFPECNAIMENYITTSTTNYVPCSYGYFKARNSLENKFKEYKCNAAMSFISKMNELTPQETREAYCFYLFYWLYNEFKTNHINDDINSIYKALFDYGNSGKNICNIYKYSISDNDIPYLNDLYYMNTNLYYVKNHNFPYDKKKCDCMNECSDKYETNLKKCESNNENSFCRALDDIKNKYNNLQHLTDDCTNIKCKTLPCVKIQKIKIISTRTSKSKTTIILTILILMIPLILFIIYKFLPYNSYLHREIKRIISKCRGLKKEWSKSENPEIYNNIYWNSNYNVLYSSHYIDD